MDTSRSPKPQDTKKTFDFSTTTHSNQSPSSKHTSVFGNKPSSRYIPDLTLSTSKQQQAREQELNDEGFEESQSLVSETLSQEASSGNYETDTHDSSTRCSPAELTRTTNSHVPKSSSPIGSSVTKTALQRRDSPRLSAQDKNLSRLKSFERRDSRDSISSRGSGKSQEASSFLPKRTSSLKREPPTR